MASASGRLLLQLRIFMATFPPVLPRSAPRGADYGGAAADVWFRTGLRESGFSISGCLGPVNDLSGPLSGPLSGVCDG